MTLPEHRLLALAMITLGLGSVSTGCQCGQATESTAEAAPARPGLARLQVSDLTEPAERAVDLSVDVDQVVRTAMLSEDHFIPAASDDPRGCSVQSELYYVLVQNGVPTLSVTAGQAKIAIETNGRCPAKDGVELFRAEFAETQPFGPDHDRSAEQALRELLQRVAHMSASALAGQIKMRHADNDTVTRTLATASGMGLLMEAASEAGERGLAHTVPDLARLTSHAEDAVALRAGAALGQLGVDSPEALSALAKMTEGPNTKRHFTAVQALGDIGGRNASRYLKSLAVGHPVPTMRQLAREANERALERMEPVPDSARP